MRRTRHNGRIGERCANCVSNFVLHFFPSLSLLSEFLFVFFFRSRELAVEKNSKPRMQSTKQKLAPNKESGDLNFVKLADAIIVKVNTAHKQT